MTNNRMVKAGIGICLAASFMMCGCSKSTSTKSVKLETGDISDNSIVMKVGDVGVEYSEVRNYCYLLKCQYEGNFGSKLWKYQLSDTETIGDQAKEEVANMVTQLKVIEITADNEGVSLTTDEKDQAIQEAEDVMNSASDDDKDEYCLSVQGLTELYEDNILANKMFYIATDEADTDISDEEAKQVSIQYIEIMTKGTDKNGTAIDMDNKTKEKALERAKKLRGEAKKASDFEEFADENTDSDTIEMTFGRDTEDLDEEVVDAAFDLKKGKISDVIEGSDGYYIVYCVDDNDEDATYNRKEEIIEERQTSMFKSKYAEWLKDCSVSISESFWNEFSI